jgi:hypothetical protein
MYVEYQRIIPDLSFPATGNRSHEGFDLPVAGFSNETLIDAAELYCLLGYAVIPIWGDMDPARAKVAAVEWGGYQRRRPSLEQVREWFRDGDYAGLAIVTGPISGLVVLDFDEPELLQEFKRSYPDLVETRTIQTRRGYHLYFGLAPGLSVPSRKVAGVDLLAAGRYVVAPPTVIDGVAYKVIRGGLPKILTAQDARRFQAFLDAQGRGARPSGTPRKTALQSQIAAIPESASTYRESQTPVLTAYDLVSLYRYLAEQGCRNEALFRTSLRARDDGWTLANVIACLADSHAQQPTTGAHRPETHTQRHHEAIRTIRSAFSRPPRRRVTLTSSNYQQLPNTCREKLFHFKLTGVVRVIEGLRLKGVQPGQSFTRKDAEHLLSEVVGRDTIDAALKATTEDNTPIFEQPASFYPPLASNDAAANKHQSPQQKCSVVSEQKSGKSPAHRPARVFAMPSNLDLCRKLGVKAMLSDPVTLDDLASGKLTRQASHRQLIKRRPGKYSRQWLAQRLGITPRTLVSYNREIPIHSRPTYWTKPIFWSNLNAIPDFDVGGTFLEDARSGKRYPAKQEIAKRLLGQGKTVLYKRQGASFYWYGDHVPSLPETRASILNWTSVASSLPPERTLPPPKVEQPRRPLPPPVQPGVSPPSIPAGTVPAAPEPSTQPPVTSSKPAGKPKRRSKRHYRKPLADAALERLAQRISDQVRGICADPGKQMSLATARRLVDEYGAQLVEQILRLMAQRHNISSPAGFLITVLRSTAKVGRTA